MQKINNLEISFQELKWAESQADRTIEKFFGNKMVKIMVFNIPSRHKNKLAQIEQKIKTNRGLNTEEQKLAIRANLIDKDQAWFWTTAWQKRIKEAKDDLKKGRFKTSSNFADLVSDLEN